MFNHVVVHDVPVHVLDHHGQFVNLLLVEQGATLEAGAEGRHQAAAIVDRIDDELVALLAGIRISGLVPLLRCAPELRVAAERRANASRALCARLGVSLASRTVADHAVADVCLDASFDCDLVLFLDFGRHAIVFVREINDQERRQCHEADDHKCRELLDRSHAS